MQKKSTYCNLYRILYKSFPDEHLFLRALLIYIVRKSHFTYRKWVDVKNLHFWALLTIQIKILTICSKWLEGEEIMWWKFFILEHLVYLYSKLCLTTVKVHTLLKTSWNPSYLFTETWSPKNLNITWGP